MTTDYTSAINEIFGPLNLVWASIVAANGALNAKLYIQGLPEPEAPDAVNFWGRLSQLTIARRQVSFTTASKKRHRVEGRLILQLFVPMAQAENASFWRGRNIAKAVKGVYSELTTPSGVQFLNVSIEELPNDGKRFRFNVIAEYNYDEIG